MPAKLRAHAAPAALVSLAGILALALAGVIHLSGGRALGQQLSCGDTITTDTTLDSDLVDCPNNGIVIGADDLTLDLNGHTVGGDGTEFAGCPENEFCDVGLLNDGHDGVTVRDGSVRDFTFGVVVVGARHNRVVDITVSSSDGTGIILFKSSRNRLIRNSAHANGLQLDQGGISLNRSDHNLVKRNALRRNGDLGVFMEKSDHNHIRKNRMGRNPEGGIITEGNANKIVRNRMARNGGGIQITIVNRGTKAVGNVVRGNDVRASRAGGISVDDLPKRTRISRNHVVGSGRDGINVLSRSTKLTKNRAVRNGDLGIDAVQGVIDGGGNRASGNGDPRQCVNVKCH
jgi:parallel beta-helix repeat protein